MSNGAKIAVPNLVLSVLVKIAVALSLTIAVAMTSCAQERPVKSVLPNPNRVSKNLLLAGQYLYLKSVVDVKSPGTAHRRWAPGRHLESDRVIRFVPVDKDWIDVVAVSPIFSGDSSTPQNQTLARFHARYVDIKRKQTSDGQDTHEEEETEQRNTWDQREFVVIDWTDDRVEPLKGETKSTSLVKSLEVDETTGALNFAVQHYLNDETLVTVRYSFLRETEAPGYEKRPYSADVQMRFGFFMTTVYAYDEYKRLTRDRRQQVMNRIDTSKPFVLYFSANFPDHLKQSVREVIDDCNRTFVTAIGKPLLQVENNSGQEMGDLRYNMIVYEDSTDGEHGILAYGPSFTHPMTGQILKGDVFLHASSIRRAQFTDSLLESSFADIRSGTRRPVALRWLDPLFDEAADEAIISEPPESPVAPGTSPGTLTDPKVKDLLDRKFDYDKTLRRMRDTMQSAQMQRTTKLGNEAVLRVQKLKAEGVSQAGLERIMFKPTFAHELLHVLGLRHNFLASADAKPNHRGSHGEPSSVLDYPFVFSETLDTIGPYDIAALTYLYTSNPAVHASLLAEGYLFCTDDHVLDSRFPLCQQYDAGTNLYTFIENQIQRYAMSFFVNNVRHDEVHFDLTDTQYADRVYSMLVPIRQAYDNAHAIVVASRTGSLHQLWSIIGSRIEYDGLPPKKLSDLPRHVEQIQIGVEPQIRTGTGANTPIYRYIDRRKLEGAIADARGAKKLAFGALSRILREPRRREYPVLDLIERETQSRGVLVDKMLSLKLLAARTPSPLHDGSSYTMYSTLEHSKASEVFVELLSNTSKMGKGENAQYVPRLYNPNLRTQALDLLTNELAQPGVSAEARLILSLEKVAFDPALLKSRQKFLNASAILEEVMTQNWGGAFQIEDPIKSRLQTIAGFFRLNQDFFGSAVPGYESLVPLLRPLWIRSRAALVATTGHVPSEQASWEQVEMARAGIRLQYRRFYRRFIEGNLNQQAKEESEKEVTAAETNRNRFNVAYANAGGGVYYKTQVTLPERILDTATGHLIRDNINRLEDRLDAVNQLTQDSFKHVGEDGIVAGRPDSLVGGLRTTLKLGRTSEILSDDLANERLFLQEIYRRFQRGFNQSKTDDFDADDSRNEERFD